MAIKRLIVVLSTAALFALVLFTVACAVLPLPEWSHPKAERCLVPPCDFRLRLNELDCLKDGVNPYDVWNRTVVKAPYYPLHHPECATKEFCEPINAYTPWEYTLALPFSWMPRRMAWSAYVLLMVMCLGVLCWGGYGIGRLVGKTKADTCLFAALPPLVVIYPIWSNFCIGNYAVPILAALFMMCWCLNRGHDIWAGVFWAIAMIKPQNSLLMAVPLLMRGKIKTCMVAAAICIVASIPPALMCKTSVIALIWQAPTASTGGFFGCATLPAFLCGYFNATAAIALAAAIGVVICIALTFLMRRSSNWMLFAMPAVMCSISWSYTTSYSYALAWFLAVCILWAVCVAPSLRRGILAGCALLLLPRFYTCWRGATSLFGACRIPVDVDHTIETLVSLGVLILTAAFCLDVSKDKRIVC